MYPSFFSRKKVLMMQDLEPSQDLIRNEVDPISSHTFGLFCSAKIRVNGDKRILVQAEEAPFTSFFGFYDGHDGEEAAVYLRNHLWSNIQVFASKDGFTADVLRLGFEKTEHGFIEKVIKEIGENPGPEKVGSSCLVLLLVNTRFLVANVGCSRVVIGRLLDDGTKTSCQISKDHRVNLYCNFLFSGDQDQSFRVIGSARFKKPKEFLASSTPELEFLDITNHPLARSDPEVHSGYLDSSYKFMIIGNKNFWEHMTNDDAVKIVFRSHTFEAALILAEAAVKNAGKLKGDPFEDIAFTSPGDRKQIHSGFGLSIVYINHEMLNHGEESQSC